MQHKITKAPTIISITMTEDDFRLLYAATIYHAFNLHSGQGLGKIGNMLADIAAELGDTRDIGEVAVSDKGAWR